jgi:DNA-binding MarR family transcriptional regulator
MPDTLEAPYRLSDQLCFAVYSTAHAFNRVYKPLLERIGLTYPQYLAMLVLWERDGLAVKAIGDQLFLDSGTLTPLLKRLESAGLVERRRSRDDERVVHIHLTPAGRAMQEEVATVFEGIGCASGLTAETAGKLKEALEAVRRQLQAGAVG